MDYKEIINFLTPIILILLGVFLRTTKNTNYIYGKNHWKFFLIGGIILLIIRSYNYFKFNF